MVHTYKRVKLDPGQYTILSGINNHEVELPFAEDIDLWVDWKADQELTVWLVFTDGKEIPYGIGYDGHFNLLTSNLLSIVLKSSKKCTTAVSVLSKDLRVKDKDCYTPVQIALPETQQGLALTSLIGETIRAELARHGIMEEVEIGEEDDLGEEDDEEGFGPGFMEEEEPVVEARRQRRERGVPAADALPTDARSFDASESPTGSEPDPASPPTGSS